VTVRLQLFELLVLHSGHHRQSIRFVGRHCGIIMVKRFEMTVSRAGVNTPVSFMERRVSIS
jgi:hypothetical protein